MSECKFDYDLIKDIKNIENSMEEIKDKLLDLENKKLKNGDKLNFNIFIYFLTILIFDIITFFVLLFLFLKKIKLSFWMICILCIVFLFIHFYLIGIIGIVNKFFKDEKND